MTLDDLMSEVAKVALAERKRYEIKNYAGWPYSIEQNCRVIENGCIVHGGDTWEFAAAQLYVERRVLEAVFRYMAENAAGCPDLIGCKFREGLKQLSGEAA